MQPDRIIIQIKAAFIDVEPPPSWCLTNSHEGTEPLALEQEFVGIPTWDSLTPEFLDSTPDGFGSALNFFSDEAFRYYLSAYLIAALRDQLKSVDPLFHLTHGLENSSAEELINPRRYGSRRWRAYAIYRHSVFNAKQVSAIVAYLNHELVSIDRTEMEKQQITEAIHNYWKDRAV